MRKKKERVSSKHCKPTIPTRRMALKEEATIEEEVDVVVAVTTGMNKEATMLMTVKGMVVEAMRLVAEVVDVVDKEDMQNHKFRAIFVRDLCMTSMTLGIIIITRR